VRKLSVFIILSMVTGSAFAGDPELREKIECAPGKDFAKMAKAISELKAEQIDTINTNPSFTLKPNDNGPMPTRVFRRSKDGSESEMKFSEDGSVSDFLKLFEGDKKAEFCVEDAARAGQPNNKDAYAFNMRFNMNFLNNSGTYPMAELEDGLKDGKTALKKIIGTPGALFVPSLSHIYVEYDDKAATPDFQSCNTTCETVKHEKLGDAYLIAYDDLEELGAKELKVSGGVHRISPSMSPEKMAKVMKPKSEKDAKE